MKNGNAIRAWVVVVGILLIFALTAVFAVQSIRDTANNALQPVSDLSTGVSTQVAQVLQPVSDLSSGVSTQVAQVLHPTPTILPNPETIIYQVRTLARLETIQYSVEKVITAEIGQDFLEPLLGDRLLLVAHGYVIAGVDLEKLLPENLRSENGVLYVELPPAEIFIATLDNDKSYVFDRDTGIFTKGNVNLETQARQAAEDEIREAALEDGILEQAQANAEAYIHRLLRSLGFVEVIFVEPESE